MKIRIRKLRRAGKKKLEQDAETENPEETSAEDDIVEALKDENRKLKEDYLRAYADAENTKKRCAGRLKKTASMRYRPLRKIC